MQWRMIARRCPSGSMTLVGDFGQASRPGVDGVERRARRAARSRRTARGRAVGELPHAGRDHGLREPPAPGGGARSGAGDRSAAPAPGGAPCPRPSWSRPRMRAAVSTSGTVAVIAARVAWRPHGRVARSRRGVRHGRGDRRTGRGARRSSPGRVRPRRRGRAVRPGCRRSCWLRLLFVVLTRATHHGRAQPLPEALGSPRLSPAGRCLRMTITEADRSAADVAWDLEPLVDGAGEGGVDALLDEAEARAVSPSTARSRSSTPRGWPRSWRSSRPSAIWPVGPGRTPACASRSTPRTPRTVRSSPVRRSATAINNEILFVELEWAALPDERGRAAGRRPARVLCRHYLEAARRYRPHLLSEPEERILSDKSLTATAWSACSRSSRRRSPSTSAPRPAR